MTLRILGLLRTAPGRKAVLLLMVALLVTLAGSGVLWGIVLQIQRGAGYQPPEYLTAFVARYLAGEPSAWVATVVWAPLLEEVLARGLLLTALLWFYPQLWAVLTAAILFAAAHLNWAQFLPALWLGLVLGTVYAQTGSLLLCILGHAFYNAQFWIAGGVFGFDPYGLLTSGPVSLLRLALAAGGIALGLRLGRFAFDWLPPGSQPHWRQANPRHKHWTAAP